MSGDVDAFILSLTVEDKPGVMERISRIFARRSINIDSITVGRISPGISRIILSFKTELDEAKFVSSLLRKMFLVKSVDRLDPDNSVTRELAIVKFKTPDREAKLQVLKVLDEMGARILYTELSYIIAELTGSPSRIDEVLSKLSPYAFEFARSGIAAINL
ncbi:MAG TPA: acetolactate synthase small subunit [Candidatus Bathyarchaeota archaeon]|nr:acetolactate synthase small subunit [Candidatus Bathyarchaeota archaeon]